MQSHPLIFCITFCISIGLIFFPLNPQYTFRSVPHTTEEIGQLLGKPDFRRFDGSLEQWEYQSGGIATSCKFLIIEFRNGKVTSMDSYNEIAKETSVGDLYSSKISLDTVGSIDDNEFEKIYNETKNSVFKDSTLEKAIINLNSATL